MAIEIERKSLVASDAWRAECFLHETIRQGYLARTENRSTANGGLVGKSLNQRGPGFGKSNLCAAQKRLQTTSRPPEVCEATGRLAV